VRELVRDGDTGLLVTPGRTGELSRAISTLLHTPDLSERLASAGRQHVSRDFDVDRSARQLIGLFEHILEPGAPRPESGPARAGPSTTAGRGHGTREVGMLTPSSAGRTPETVAH
jgi:hypothetical protein